MFTILYVPSNHAGSDSEAFWLRPVMAITASVQPELGWNCVCRIRLSASVSAPFFQRKCKTDPDPMWMSWSGSGQTHRVRKLVGVLESSGLGFLAGRNRPATAFRLGSVLPAQTSRIIVCKTSAGPV